MRKTQRCSVGPHHKVAASSAMASLVHGAATTRAPSQGDGSDAVRMEMVANQARMFHQRGGGSYRGGGGGGGYAPRAPPLPQRGRGGGYPQGAPYQQQQQQPHSYGYSRGGGAGGGGRGGMPMQQPPNSRGGSFGGQPPLKVAESHVCGNGDADYQNFGFGAATGGAPSLPTPTASPNETESNPPSSSPPSLFEDYSAPSAGAASSTTRGGGSGGLDFSRGLFVGSSEMAELQAAQQQASMQGPTVSQLHYANALPFQHYLAEAKKRCHPERNYYEPLITFIGDVTTALFDFIVPVIDTNQQQQHQALLQRKAAVEQQNMNPGAASGHHGDGEGGGEGGPTSAMSTVGPIYNRLERLPQISGYHAKFQHKLGSMDSLIAFFDGLFFETMDVLAVWTVPPNSLSVTPIPVPVVYQSQGGGANTFASTTSATPTGILTTTTYAFEDDDDMAMGKKRALGSDPKEAPLPPLHKIKRKGISAPHGLVLLNKSLAVPTATAHLPPPPPPATTATTIGRNSLQAPAPQLTAADYSRRAASGAAGSVSGMLQSLGDMQATEPQAVAVVSRPYFISTSSTLSSTNTQLCRRVDSSVRLFKGRVSRKLLYSRLLYPLLAIDADFHTNSSDTVKALEKQKEQQRHVDTFWKQYFEKHGGSQQPGDGEAFASNVVRDWERVRNGWDTYVMGDQPMHPSGKTHPHPTMAPIPPALVDLATRALQGRLFDDSPASATSSAGTTANQYAPPPRPTRGSSTIAPPPPPSAGGRGRQGARGGGPGLPNPNAPDGNNGQDNHNHITGASSDEASIALQFDYLFELGFGPLHSLMLDSGRGEFRMAPVPAGSHRSMGRMSGRDSGSGAGKGSTDYIAMYTPMVLPPLPVYRHHVAELRGVLPISSIAAHDSRGLNVAAQFHMLTQQAAERYLRWSISTTPLLPTSSNPVSSTGGAEKGDASSEALTRPRRTLLDPFFNNTYFHVTGGNVSADSGASSSSSTANANSPASGTSSLFSAGLASTFSAQQVTISNSDVHASIADWMKSSPHELAAERILIHFIHTFRSAPTRQAKLGQGTSYVPLNDFSEAVVANYRQLFPALSLLHPTSRLTYTPKGPDQQPPQSNGQAGAPRTPLTSKAPPSGAASPDELPSQPTQIRVKIFIEALCALFPLHVSLVFPDAGTVNNTMKDDPSAAAQNSIPTGIRVRNAYCVADSAMPEGWARYLSTYVRPQVLPHTWAAPDKAAYSGEMTLEVLLGQLGSSSDPLKLETLTNTEAVRLMEARLGWRHDASRVPFKSLHLSRHPDNIRATVRLQPALERTVEYFSTLLLEGGREGSARTPKQASLLASFSWLLDSFLINHRTHERLRPALTALSTPSDPLGVGVSNKPIESSRPPLGGPHAKRCRESIQMQRLQSGRRHSTGSPTSEDDSWLEDASQHVLGIGEGGPLLQLVANGFSPEAVLRFKSLYRIAVAAADAGHLGREFQATYYASNKHLNNNGEKGGNKGGSAHLTPHQRRKQEAEAKRLQVLKELGDDIGLNSVVDELASAAPKEEAVVELHLNDSEERGGGLSSSAVLEATTTDEETLVCEHLIPTAAAFGGRMKDELIYSSMVTRLQQRIATEVLQRKSAKAAVKLAEEELEAMQAVSRAANVGGGGEVEISNDVSESDRIGAKGGADAVEVVEDDEDFFAAAQAQDTMTASLKAANRVPLFPNHTDVLVGEALLRAAEIINAASKGTEVPILPLLEAPLQAALAEAVATSAATVAGHTPARPATAANPIATSSPSSDNLLEEALIRAIPSVPVSVCELSRVLGVPMISLFNSIQFIAADHKKRRDARIAEIRHRSLQAPVPLQEDSSWGARAKINLVRCHDGADALVWVERY